MSTRSSSACSATPEPSAHQALRSATAAAHERTDALFSGFALDDGHGYRAFLLAHARAFLPVEAALDTLALEAVLPSWPDRRRGDALYADLRALGLGVPPAEPFDLEPGPAAWGALYVLEGSRLGGALLSRQVPAGLPKAYLGTPSPSGSWRKFLELLNEQLYETKMIAAAIAAAMSVFVRFETAARLELERLGR